jgi:tetratricopeptide (TPR) repeat protein
MPADFAAGDDQLGLGAAGSAPAVAADEPYGFDTHGGGPATGDMSLDGIDALDPGGGGAAAPSDGAYGDDGLSAGLEAELEEADFFVQQALYAEAREILIGLQARYPQNRLVQAKLQDVDAMEAAASSDGETATSVGESEDLPLEPSAPPAAAAPAPAKRPTVIAKPLGEADADTHFDLGLAYKEMGLHDEAIREFLLVRETPGRAVQCHLMIGLCNLERGKLSEAVTEFKNGLYVEGISDREALSLYFELGSAYQSLADAREALYYFEKVAKRDLRFRDVGTRIEQVKAQIAAAGAPRSVDATLDSTGDDFR